MGTAAYILIIIATTMGAGSESSGALLVHEVTPFTSQQTCETAGKKAVAGLTLTGQGETASPRAFHGAVRVGYVCIEKK